MKRFKRDMSMIFAGLVLGAMLTGGAVAAGIMAEPSWSPIYVDGRQVQMTAYNIAGNNFVKLRDIGQAVGFNVYYQNGVQVDSDAPYTGEAPVVQTATQATPAEAIHVSCYKNGPLNVGDGSGLMISPSGTAYTVTSSNSNVLTVEKALDQFWKINAVSPGTAEVTVTASDGRTGSVSVTVTGKSSHETVVSKPKSTAIDLSANMDIRQEMIRLINQARAANGVEPLVVNEALMNAAQDCSTQMFRSHNSEYECGAAIAYGYPHGFGDNLTWFTGSDYMKNVAQTAVNNWINSPGHFQTMVTGRYKTIGVGVTIKDGKACCYMFAGDPNSINAYS